MSSFSWGALIHALRASVKGKLREPSTVLEAVAAILIARAFEGTGRPGALWRLVHVRPLLVGKIFCWRSAVHVFTGNFGTFGRSLAGRGKTQLACSLLVFLPDSSGEQLAFFQLLFGCLFCSS